MTDSDIAPRHRAGRLGAAVRRGPRTPAAIVKMAAFVSGEKSR